mmetsp:Transcript_69287/g.202857  ORF Transcript_69287/g.202857 Transcript_69287/m.202857 type:complete len:433 (-) Transcript_69287:249-1547(-)
MQRPGVPKQKAARRHHATPGVAGPAACEQPRKLVVLHRRYLAVVKAVAPGLHVALVLHQQRPDVPVAAGPDGRGRGRALGAGGPDVEHALVRSAACQAWAHVVPILVDMGVEVAVLRSRVPSGGEERAPQACDDVAVLAGEELAEDRVDVGVPPEGPGKAALRQPPALHEARRSCQVRHGLPREGPEAALLEATVRFVHAGGRLLQRLGVNQAHEVLLELAFEMLELLWRDHASDHGDAVLLQDALQAAGDLAEGHRDPGTLLLRHDWHGVGARLQRVRGLSALHTCHGHRRLLLCGQPLRRCRGDLLQPLPLLFAKRRRWDLCGLQRRVFGLRTHSFKHNLFRVLVALAHWSDHLWRSPGDDILYGRMQDDSLAELIGDDLRFCLSEAVRQRLERRNLADIIIKCLRSNFRGGIRRGLQGHVRARVQAECL